MKRAAAALLVLLLPAGCVTVSPLPAPLECDTRLAGVWTLPPGATRGDLMGPGDRIEVDAECVARLHRADRPVVTFALRSFRTGGRHLLVFDEPTMSALFETPRHLNDEPLRADRGALLAYRLDGDRFDAVAADPDYAGPRIRTGAWPGRREGDDTVHLEGPAEAVQAALRDPRLFPPDDVPEDHRLRLRRVASLRSP